MASMNETIILLLTNVTEVLDQYISVGILIFGVIGNLLNICILSQRPLRSNPCTLFFNVSSIAGLICILSGVPTRLMAGWSEDPTDTIGWLCKIRSFILYLARTNFLWFIVLATIDRWCSSCVNVRRRQMSSLKNAQRSIIIIILFSFFLNAFLLYCYDANQVGGPAKCHGQTMVCRLSLDFIYVGIIILLPLGLILIFGLLIVWNVHHTQNRIRNVHTTKASSMRTTATELSGGQLQKKKENRQLLLMLLGQIIILFLLISPHAIQKLYTTFVYSTTKSEFENAVDDFFYSFVITLTFLGNGMPFYIYTLTGGNVFRKALFNLFKIVQNKMKCIN